LVRAPIHPSIRAVCGIAGVIGRKFLGDGGERSDEPGRISRIFGLFYTLYAFSVYKDQSDQHNS
jgi:hypothetical protein